MLQVYDERRRLEAYHAGLGWRDSVYWLWPRAKQDAYSVPYFAGKADREAMAEYAPGDFSQAVFEGLDGEGK